LRAARIVVRVFASNCTEEDDDGLPGFRLFLCKPFATQNLALPSEKSHFAPAKVGPVRV